MSVCVCVCGTTMCFIVPSLIATKLHAGTKYLQGKTSTSKDPTRGGCFVSVVGRNWLDSNELETPHRDRRWSKAEQFLQLEVLHSSSHLAVPTNSIQRL